MFPLERDMKNTELSLAMKRTAAKYDAFRRENKVSLVVDDELYAMSGFFRKAHGGVIRSPKRLGFYLSLRLHEREGRDPSRRKNFRQHLAYSEIPVLKNVSC
jgi:hypothetical protein